MHNRTSPVQYHLISHLLKWIYLGTVICSPNEIYAKEVRITEVQFFKTNRFFNWFLDRRHEDRFKKLILRLKRKMSLRESVQDRLFLGNHPKMVQTMDFLFSQKDRFFNWVLYWRHENRLKKCILGLKKNDPQSIDSELHIPKRETRKSGPN